MEKEQNQDLAFFSEKRFDQVLLKFLISEPFFATIIRSFCKHRTEDIPTAGVNCTDEEMNLYWNPKFIDSLSVQEVFGLLKHECYHLILGHVTNRKQEPHMLWNIATDLAINSMIPVDELPKCGLIPGVRPEIKPSEGSKISNERMSKIEKLADFIEQLPTRMSSEWYMETIKQDEELSDLIEDLYGSKIVMSLDEHLESEMSDVDAKIAKAKIEKALKEAQKISRQRGYGSLDQKIKDLVNEKLSAEVDWKKH